MIRIRRRLEAESCPDLREVRERELGRIRKAIAAGDEITLGTEYKVARTSLAHAQHHKCCYCEQRQQSVKWKHVEHFRPQSQYWWLTWTWDNLLFACEQCNTSKGAHFPIDPESQALIPEEQPPGGERAQLIDPSREAPREHIQFIPSADRWFPRARNDSPRGLEMVTALGWVEDEGFERLGLLDLWKDRAADLRACVASIEAALETNDEARIRGVWERQTFRYRVAHAEFVALSLDVLDRQFPDHVRRRWGLSLDVIEV